MSGTVSTRWFFSDWMSAEDIRACSLAARGLWMDMLCIAAANKGEHYGFLMVGGRPMAVEQLAKRVGSTLNEVQTLLDELEKFGVFSRDRRRKIYCRRMIRAYKNRVNGREGGNPKLLENKKNPNPVIHPPVVLPLPEPEPKPRRKKESPPTPPGVVQHFEKFWASYPRREGRNPKDPAERKFVALVKSGVDPVAIVAGAERYAEEQTRLGHWGSGFVTQAITWLHQGSWKDYTQSPQSSDKVTRTINGIEMTGVLNADGKFIPDPMPRPIRKRQPEETNGHGAIEAGQSEVPRHAANGRAEGVLHGSESVPNQSKH